MLTADKTFLDFVVDAAITPTHLTTTGCGVSPLATAINCNMRLCPRIMAWLMGDRIGDWVCIAHQNDDCDFQHDCGGGRECDVNGCALLHPEEETRWIVLHDKSSAWAEAMTLDEAMGFQGEDSSVTKALAEDTPDCTYADVWRASFPALAFGRKSIATAVAVAVAVPKQTPAPEEPIMITKQVQDSAPAEGLVVKPPPLAAAPAPAVHDPADAAAGDQTPAGPAAGDKAAEITADPAAGDKTPTDPAAGDKTPAKIAVAPAVELPVALLASAAASVAPAGSAKPDAVAKRTLEQSGSDQRKRSRLDDTQGFQFIAQTRAYLTDDMSEEYQKVLRRAAKLTPAERAALLTKLSGMIQEDQTTSLRLLDQLKGLMGFTPPFKRRGGTKVVAKSCTYERV